jgi:hypothetical protein
MRNWTQCTEKSSYPKYPPWSGRITTSTIFLIFNETGDWAYPLFSSKTQCNIVYFSILQGKGLEYKPVTTNSPIMIFPVKNKREREREKEDEEEKKKNKSLPGPPQYFPHFLQKFSNLRAWILCSHCVSFFKNKRFLYYYVWHFFVFLLFFYEKILFCLLWCCQENYGKKVSKKSVLVNS